jgi:tetratricopeptide (TPR) repeat protein
LKIVTRLVVAAALALCVTVAATQGVDAKKDAPGPSPSPSGSPAPLPTATPEAPDTAIPRLEAKIKADPSDKDSMQQLAGYYLQVNKPDQALGLTQRLIALGVKTAQSYYLDGISNESLGHVKEATDDFEQASNLEPTNAQILLTLTNLYLQTNRASDAERVAKRATTFNPTDKRAFENYGLVLGQEGKYDEARTQFQAAAKLDPKDPLPVVLQARAYVSQKALALAAADFDQALVIDPKYPDALLGKASLEAANHDVKDAIPTYETLYALEPSDEAKAAVLVQEYQLYRDEKQNDQALATLKRAEATFPNVAAVHIAYGDYDVSLGKDQAAAETEWKTALGPSRDNPDALQRLGELALSQNKRSDALGYFKRLSEVVPGEPGVWSALGSVQAENGDFQSAHDSYRHSFELARTPQALAGLGTADLELKNYKECGQVFGAIDRNAQPFMKANPQLLFVYAKCSAETGDKSTARQAYSRFKTYVKPGSPLAHQIDAAIASLSPASAKGATKASPKPQSSAKPSH